VTRKTIIPGSRPPNLGRQRVASVRSSASLEVLLVLRGRAALLSSDVFALGSRSVLAREHVDSTELSTKWRARTADVRAVRQFAARYGLEPVCVDVTQGTVTLRGRADRMARAFSTQLNHYRKGSLLFHSHEAPIAVPSELGEIVAGVFGLDNRRVSTRPRFAAGSPPAPPPVDKNTKLPSAFRTLYAFPKGATGKGQCIGLLEFGGGFDRRKLTSYLAKLGVRTPKIVVRQIGTGRNLPLDEPGRLSPDVEVYMDLEILASTAPGATLVVYFGENSSRGWVETLRTAVCDRKYRPSVLSISWGQAEQYWDAQTIRALDETLQVAAMLGITVCCSSGDSGVFEAARKPYTVAFPASSPHVLACGGTRLTKSARRAARETVWNQSSTVGLTSGGGISRIFDLPPFQKGRELLLPVGNRRTGRGIPDVAANASSLSGYLIWADDTRMSMGGTSAAAPLWAGLIACMNESLGRRIGYLTPLLYTGGAADSGALRDIVEGNNQMRGRQGYRARAGWDACTGLGTPHGDRLLRWLGTERATVASRPSSAAAAPCNARRRAAGRKSSL
jgi:kumamolisin